MGIGHQPGGFLGAGDPPAGYLGHCVGYPVALQAQVVQHCVADQVNGYHLVKLPSLLQHFGLFVDSAQEQGVHADVVCQ